MPGSNRVVTLFQWVIIIIFFIIIVLLINQNIQLKTSNISERKVYEEAKSDSFENKMKDYFLFRNFPMNLKMEDFYFFEKSKNDYINGYIIMIFDLTVCGKCLKEELDLISSFKEAAEQKNIFFIAIIGISNESEESEIINLRRTGNLFFPFKLVSLDTLYNTLKLPRENFLDTPFYIYTSHMFKILDIFKPQYLEQEELHRWLTIITNQDTS